MRISELVKNLQCKILGDDVEIGGISYDSRKVSQNQIFCAIRGYKTDGHKYINTAINNGAIAILVEEEQDVDAHITQIIVQDTRETAGKIAAAYHNFPANKLKIIGVTGTNGKTTTTYLIKAILEQAKFKVGLIGTIQNLIGDKVSPAKRTTPESLELQELLAQMYQEGVTHVVMEVSSHALELKRVSGINFDVAVYTNLTQDHLDFHHDFQHYYLAKAKLFSNLHYHKDKSFSPVAIINYDDAYGLQVASKSSAPVYSYGIDQHTQFYACDLEVGNQGVKYRLVTPFGEINLSLKLTGRFNVYNSMAAAAACLSLGVDINSVKSGLESILGVSGRFELVNHGQDFAVIVDYAHTPDSLTNVLQTARALTNGKVITVFGAGGDRDRTKRPLMGEAAAMLSDYVIITSDNPRSEDPSLIAADIEQGIRRVHNPHLVYEIELDRRSAVNKAINLAQSNDVVIIAGKGHEDYQEFSDHTITFDDRTEAHKALKELDF